MIVTIPNNIIVTIIIIEAIPNNYVSIVLLLPQDFRGFGPGLLKGTHGSSTRAQGLASERWWLCRTCTVTACG